MAEAEIPDVPEREDVDDDSEGDELTPAVSYDVTSYGADPDVEGLVRRLRRDEILVPPFQRDYVWNLPEASRFLESLLLGLPVPGIFLANEPDTNKLLVIDGQQRLKSLLFFYDGYFNPKPDERRQRVFALAKVQKHLESKTYKTLAERDRIRLDNSVIHATIVKQASPPGDDTSIYHIFARLNSGGRRLAPQEIRAALYHGEFLNTIRVLNEHPSWRALFGGQHSRLKDQELILRFFALYYEPNRYSRPMEEYLNKFAGRHKNPTPQFLDEARRLFVSCTDLFAAALGREAFRPTRALNAAVFDSAMVGLARRLAVKPILAPGDVAQAYRTLLTSGDYTEAVSRSTADEAFVERRLRLAAEAFAAA